MTHPRTSRKTRRPWSACRRRARSSKPTAVPRRTGAARRSSAGIARTVRPAVVGGRTSAAPRTVFRSLAFKWGRSVATHPTVAPRRSTVERVRRRRRAVGPARSTSVAARPRRALSLVRAAGPFRMGVGERKTAVIALADSSAAAAGPMFVGLVTVCRRRARRLARRAASLRMGAATRWTAGNALLRSSAVGAGPSTSAGVRPRRALSWERIAVRSTAGAGRSNAVLAQRRTRVAEEGSSTNAGARAPCPTP
jgi:hypothetical protein